MWLIAALGNDGVNYARTRHNVGWIVMDQLYSDIHWSVDGKKNALVSDTQISGQRVFLCKPTTMMNLSGMAVSATASFYNILPDSIIVMHDDLDIPFGQVQIAYNKGSAQHNGVESVTRHLNTAEYVRIRIGIGPKSGQIPLKSFVLEAFSVEEQKVVEEKVSNQVGLIIQSIITDGLSVAMNRFN